MRTYKLKALLVSILVTSITHAGINLKNGNFYIGFTDISVGMKLTRVYNSKSAYNGWFGFGWGTDFETFLSVNADGSVLVHENGSGARTRFVPRNPVDPEAAANKIVKAMMKAKKLNSANAKKYIEKLTKDAELRQLMARRYNVKSEVAVNSILYSNNRGLQKVKVTKDGYVRYRADGGKDHFNKEGKLSKITEKNNSYVNFSYKKDQLFSIKNSAGQQIYFEWYDAHHVKNIWSSKDAKAEYKFEGNNLVYSKDVGRNWFKYIYDNNHNLTKIEYYDGRTIEVSYKPGTFFAASYKDTDGELTKYDYGSNEKNPNFHYWTWVSKKGPSGKEIKDKYEYEIKTKTDGEQYTYRIETIINGLKTETIYSECCSVPVKISRGNIVTNFEYNEDGLLTKKTSTTGEFVQLEYHKTFKKITKVVNASGTTSFEYDKKGNLKIASNKGSKVLLIYDTDGRISKMLDRDKKTKKERKLAFKYNQLGKPRVITMEGVGTINVQYNRFGEIEKVESKAGHKMALQVTQAFQNLLTIVKPAGVNLSL